MNFVIHAFSTVMMLVVALSSQAAAFIVKECNFSVDLPDVTSPQKLPDSTTDTGAIYILQHGTWAYAMSCNKYKAAPGNTDAALNAAQGRLKGAIRSSRKVTAAGKPGRDVDLTTARGSIARYRFVYSGATQYTIALTVPADEATSPKVNAYFDSFRLTGG